MSASTSPLVLLGDIGGSNCRLALETISAPRTIVAQRVCSTDDFPSPREAIAAFLAHAGGATPRRAVLALAGPISGDEAQLTNTSWRFERRSLMDAFGFEHLLFVNDLAAQARAVFSLPAADLLPVGVGVTPPFARRMSVVGAGTGLGVACIDPTLPNPIITTEGGHAGFAPGDDVEMELLRLWRRHLGFVTNEHVISGPGLVRLYRALGALKDLHAEPIDGPEIVQRAIEERDPLSREATERFAKIYGAVAADVVLVQGAAGVVLVGAIANAIAPIMQLGGFRARFEQRGPGRGYLSNAPSMIATAPDLGLKGASELLRDTAE